MARGVGYASLAVLIVGSAACGRDQDPRLLQPAIQIVDGVEIATLPSIPDPFDSGYRLAFEVVQEVRTVTNDPDEPLVYDAATVTELSSGHLLVHDAHADRPLVVLDPVTETVVARFGKEGQGPGELGGGLTLTEASDASIIVFDRANRQIHHFSPQGTWLESRGIHIDQALGKSLASRRTTSFLVSALQLTENEWHRDLNHVDTSGAAVEVLRLPEPSREAEPGRIQRGRVLWTALQAGVVTMWSDRPTIFVHDESGSLLREIHLPLERRQISAEDIEAQLDHYGPIANTLRPGPAALTNELYATSDSTFAMFLSGLWRSAQDPPLPPGDIMWRVFTTGGAYFGVVPLPDDFRYLGQSDNELWARVLDEQGYPVIRRLRLIRQADANEAN